MGRKISSGNFMNSTNNRLKSINGKLKQVVSKFSSLEQFIDQFFIILSVLRRERNYKAVVSYQKVRCNPHVPSSPQAAYSNLLTSYASSFVFKQIDLSMEHEYEYLNRDNTNTIY